MTESSESYLTAVTSFSMQSETSLPINDRNIPRYKFKVNVLKSLCPIHSVSRKGNAVSNQSNQGGEPEHFVRIRLLV